MRFRYSQRKMAKLFADSEDLDQMPRSGANGASDLGLHCLPITLLGVSQLQWVKDFNILKKTPKNIRPRANEWGI